MLFNFLLQNFTYWIISDESALL